LELWVPGQRTCSPARTFGSHVLYNMVNANYAKTLVRSLVETAVIVNLPSGTYKAIV